MAYVKTHDGQVQTFPYTIGDLRKDNPHTSFPRRISEEMLSSYGVFEVEVDTAPAVDEKNYKAVRAEVPVFVDDQWRLQWSVVEKTSEEKQAYYDAAANRVRAKRDALLAETDWMALSDTTLSPEWVAYRAALRDIPSQTGFPYSVQWPVAP